MATVAVPNVSIGYGQGTFSVALVETRQVDEYNTYYIYEITCFPAAGWKTARYTLAQTTTTEYIDPPYGSEVDTSGPASFSSFKEGTDNVISLDDTDWNYRSIYVGDYTLPGLHYRYTVTALDVLIYFERLPVKIHCLGKPTDRSHGTVHGYFIPRISGLLYNSSEIVYTDGGPSAERTLTDYYDFSSGDPSLTLTAYPLTTPDQGGAPDNVFRAWIVNGTAYTENPKTISLEGCNGTTVEVIGWFGCNKILKDAGGDVLKDSGQAGAILKC